jgi:hypothetical protein
MDKPKLRDEADKVSNLDINCHVGVRQLLHEEVHQQVRIGNFNDFFTVSIEIGRGNSMEWFFSTSVWGDEKRDWEEEVRDRVAHIFEIAAHNVREKGFYPPNFWASDPANETE